MRDTKESTPRISCSERVEPDVPVRSRKLLHRNVPKRETRSATKPTKNRSMQNSRPQRAAVSTSGIAEVSKRSYPPPRALRKLLRFLFQGRQFGQQESDQENDRRTENYCKVGMQRTAQAIERRALVDKR